MSDLTDRLRKAFAGKIKFVSDTPTIFEEAADSLDAQDQMIREFRARIDELEALIGQQEDSLRGITKISSNRLKELEAIAKSYSKVIGESLHL